MNVSIEAILMNQSHYQPIGDLTLKWIVALSATPVLIPLRAAFQLGFLPLPLEFKPFTPAIAVSVKISPSILGTRVLMSFQADLKPAPFCLDV